MNELLPVHGFVLAGGKSSRMGTDKALLEFCGRPMVEIAVEKLRSFCAAVSIAGSREELASFAPVLREKRVGAGPAAGIEAGLAACEQPWAMFIPVDAPLVPGELLRTWVKDVLQMEKNGLVVSHLSALGDQATFCMIHRSCASRLTEVLDAGERRLIAIFDQLAGDAGVRWVHDAGELGGYPEVAVLERWFMNVNTPEELAQAERAASQ